MSMEYLVVAILSEMSSIREDLIVDSKKGGVRMNNATRTILQMCEETKDQRIKQLEGENRMLRAQLNEALIRIEGLEGEEI